MSVSAPKTARHSASTATLAALLALVGPAAAQSLAADINPTGDAYPSLSDSCWVDGFLYFSADDGSHGRELWRSDGTEAGTTLVKDINSGSAPSNPRYLIGFGGAVYCQANDGLYGTELWRTDGTEAGTVLVKDIRSGGGSAPTQFCVVAGELFFTANDGTTGTELWKTDGTEAGTVLVKDINPGSGASTPVELFDYNGVLVLGASDGTNGTELWRSDGTAAGTSMVIDIKIGSGGSAPHGFAVLGSNVYFIAHESNEISGELWASDGTAAGSHQVIDLDPRPLHSGIYSNPVVFNGALFFAGNNGVTGTELWTSDGTAAGTTVVAETASGGLNPEQLTVVGDRLFFIAVDSDIPELWTTDGTPAGSTPLRTVDTYYEMEGYGLTAAGSKLFLFGDDGVTGREPWLSDGTAAGTGPFADLEPGSAGSWPYRQVAAGGRVWLAADTSAFGNELWSIETATVQTFGAACAGTANRAPHIDYRGSASLGDTLTLTLSAAQPSAPAALLVGTRRADIALSANGACRWLVGASLTNLSRTADATGASSAALRVPNDANLVGAAFAFQWFAIDANGAALGVGTMSAGIEATVR